MDSTQFDTALLKGRAEQSALTKSIFPIVAFLVAFFNMPSEMSVPTALVECPAICPSIVPVPQPTSMRRSNLLAPTRVKTF